MKQLENRRQRIKAFVKLMLHKPHILISTQLGVEELQCCPSIHSEMGFQNAVKKCGTAGHGMTYFHFK